MRDKYTPGPVQPASLPPDRERAEELDQKNDSYHREAVQETECCRSLDLTRESTNLPTHRNPVDPEINVLG